MSSSRRAWRHLKRRNIPFARRLTTGKGPFLNSEDLIEEETLPNYKPHYYYPVKIGDVYQSEYQSEYQVIGKLGYGVSSTVWLCHELSNKDNFKALKVSIFTKERPEVDRRGYNLYEHLSKLNSSHPGQAGIRELHDTFDLKGIDGPHSCLLQPPMHTTVKEVMKRLGGTLPLFLLKLFLKPLLGALDFLHTEANVVHTDIKSDNIMLGIKETSVLDRYREAELADPSPRKVIDASRTIYKSRSFDKAQHWNYTLPVLCDFGEARIGRIQFGGPYVQPHAFRAPEITFEMEWGPPADVWNVACLIWDMFEDTNLFKGIHDSKGGYDPFRHLAKMVSIIGPPPMGFLRRSKVSQRCFDNEGNWIAKKEAQIVPTTLEAIESQLEGDQQTQFLRFLRSMLQWDPEDRKTAKELLEDPWLQQD